MDGFDLTSHNEYLHDVFMQSEVQQHVRAWFKKRMQLGNAKIDWRQSEESREKNEEDKNFYQEGA